MRTGIRIAVCCVAGLVVLLHAGGAAIAQGSTEDRLKALEARLAAQETEIRRLRSALGEQADTLDEELDRYLGKMEDASWWQEPGTLRPSWKNTLRFASADGDTELKMGGRIMYDMAWFDEDSDVKAYASKDFGNMAEFRRVRFFMSGKIWGNVFYKAQYDFAGSGDVAFKDVYLGVSGVPFLGHIRVGNQYEPFGLELQTSDKYHAFLEPAFLNDALVPGRSAGIMAYDTVDELDGRLGWAIGFYNGDSAQNEVDQGNAVTARVWGNPWYEEKGRRLAHLGVAVSRRIRNAMFDEFEVRPEAHTSRVKLYDFAVPDQKKQQLIGLEAALVYGPLSVQGEYVIANIDSEAFDDPSLTGYYAFVSYFVTGEHRAYKKGTFSRVKPVADFDGDGGLGAIELALRYSVVDFADGKLFENTSPGMPDGELMNLTMGVNWYLNQNTRLMLNYVMSDYGDVGDIDILQIRFQIDF